MKDSRRVCTWIARGLAIVLMSGAAVSLFSNAGLMQGEVERLERAGAQLWRAQVYFRNFTGHYFERSDLTPEDLEHTILRAFAQAAVTPPQLVATDGREGWILTFDTGKQSFAIVGGEGLNLFWADSGARFRLSRREKGGLKAPDGWKERAVPPHILLADGLWILMHCPDRPVLPTMK